MVTHIPTLFLPNLAPLKGVITLALDKDHYVLPTFMKDIHPMPSDDVPVHGPDVVVDQDTQAHPGKLGPQPLLQGLEDIEGGLAVTLIYVQIVKMVKSP